MITQKQAVCGILSLFLLFGCVGLTGCNSKTELTEISADENVVERVQVKQPLSDVKSGYTMVCFDTAKERMRAVTSKWDGETSSDYYMVNMNDWTLQPINYEEEPDVSLGGDFEESGKSTVLSYTSPPFTFYIKQYDADGKIILNKDITSCITQVKTEGDSVADDCFVGTYAYDDKVVIVMAYQIIVLTDDGGNVEYIPLDDGQIVSSAKMNSGHVICAIKEENGTYFLQEWNHEKEGWEERTQVINNWSFTGTLDVQNKHRGVLMNGAEYDFYYKNYNYIYGFNWEEKTCVKLIDYEKNQITDDDG